MAYLNANIPATYAQVRREYLYDLKEHHGEAGRLPTFWDCIDYRASDTLSCNYGKWSCILPFANLCIHTKRILMSKRFLGCDLMSWSYGIALVTILALLLLMSLDGQSGKYIGKDKKWYTGAYLFTVDWAHPESNIVDTDHSEIPHEHKCAHILALKNGNYAAQPNNRLIWSIPSFTVKDEIPTDWKTQTLPIGMLKIVP